MKISIFHKSVAILLSGTAFSQILGIITLPILTRLYSTEEMGLLAVFSAVVTILLTVVCLKLESALQIQNSDFEARGILNLCMYITVATSLFTLLFCLLAYVFFENQINKIGYYIFFVPIGMMIGGFYISLNSYALRNEKFEVVSKSRIIQSVSCASIQVGGAFILHSPIWLIVGFLLNLGAGIGYIRKKLGIKFFHHRQGFLKSKEIFLSNIKFPKFSVVESLSNTAGVQVPILLIAYGMSVSEAAFLFVAMKLIQAPMALLGSSISQVYYSQANSKLASNQLVEFTSDVLKSAIKIGVGPIIAISLLAPSLTESTLGLEWRSVGEYILIMSPWFVIQFISSPISPIMYVMGMQKKFMHLTLFGLIWKLAFTLYAVLYTTNVVEYLVFANVLFYFVCFFVFTSAAKISLKNIVKILYSSSLSILAWIGLSLIVLHIISNG